MTTDKRPRRPPVWFRLPFLAVWCLLAAAGVARLVTGEQAAETRRVALAEIGEKVTEVDPRAPPQQSEGPVHVVGRASAAAPLEDPRFGVRVQALRLDREVEMYQWQERQEGDAQGTDDRYQRTWSGRPIRSSSFGRPIGHQNPAAFPVPPASTVAGDARIGRAGARCRSRGRASCLLGARAAGRRRPDRPRRMALFP